MMMGLLQVSGNFRVYEPGTAPEGQAIPTPKPEVTGKFAPQSGKALLLIGQDKESVDAYFDATVTPPGGVAVNIDLQLRHIEDLDYLAGKYPNSTLSVGVDLKDSPTDEQIDTFLDALTSYNRPVFLHLAFRADDSPDVYVSAWKRFGERIQAKGTLSVALVWELDSCDASNIADWYPGDEHVDWVGVNYGCADAAIQFAREHLKPVMLEAASQNSSWDEWFVPFIKFVNDNNDVVRAVTYINSGESRLSNAGVIKSWKTETKQSFWLRGGPFLFDTLGFVK
jgi:hypothetical protein